MKDTIIWTENAELKWDDFIYNESKDLTDNIDAHVGISARYRLTDKIIYKSKTAFVPSKSFVSDTTNKISLRIANARFDLCEVYRRKLEMKIDSLRAGNVNNITLEYLAKQDSIFFENFSNEWTRFLEIPKTELMTELNRLENRISQELQK